MADPEPHVASPLPTRRPPPRSLLHDLLIIAAIAATVWVVHLLTRLVLLVILATFVAYVMAPLVNLAQRPVLLRGRRRHLPRGAAVAVVCVWLAGGAAAATAIVWPSAAEQLDSAIAAAPGYTESLRVWERGWSRYYERLRMPIELRHSIDASATGAGEAALVYARGSLLTLVSVISDLPWLILVPVLAVLLLKDATGIRRTVLIMLPRGRQLPAHRLLEDLNRTMASFIRAQLIASAIVGVMCGVGFALLGSPYAVLLGIMAAVFEFVPLIGPLVVAIVAISLAALHAPVLAMWTAVFLSVVRVVEDYVIYPRLMGRTIHLHPLAVILAVLAGAELFGIAGMFVAVPVVALLTVVARHSQEWTGSGTATDVPA